MKEGRSDKKTGKKMQKKENWVNNTGNLCKIRREAPNFKLNLLLIMYTRFLYSLRLPPLTSLPNSLNLSSLLSTRFILVSHLPCPYYVFLLGFDAQNTGTGGRITWCMCVCVYFARVSFVSQLFSCLDSVFCWLLVLCMLLLLFMLLLLIWLLLWWSNNNTRSRRRIRGYTEVYNPDCPRRTAENGGTLED